MAPHAAAPQPGTAPHAQAQLYDDRDGWFQRWLREERGSLNPVDRSSTDIVTLFYTSGTTGRSKGVPHDHDFIDAVAHSTTMACRYTARDVFLVTSPMFWTVAPIHCVLPIMHAGGMLVLMSRFDVDRCLDLIALHNVTSFFGVPTMYAMLVDRKRDDLARLPTLRVCMSAGAPRSPELVQEFEGLTGATLLDVYGSTEAQLIAREVHGVPRIAGSCGPLGGTVETKIVDPEGREVSRGEAGEVVARGVTCVDFHVELPLTPAGKLRKREIRRLKLEEATDQP